MTKRYYRNGKWYKHKKVYRRKRYKRKKGRPKLSKKTMCQGTPVSERTTYLLVDAGYYLTMDHSDKNYTRKQLVVKEHYNMFEYLHPVRMFIQKKYDIDLNLLELLLYLYPKGYFTWEEFNGFPRQYQYTKIKYLLDDGYFVVMRPDAVKSKQVYKLSKKASNIVRFFYQYLSGEKKMPNPRQRNPLVIKDPNTKQRRLLEMIHNMENMKVINFNDE